MRKKTFFLFFFLIGSFLYSGSISIYNDSPFVLNAAIIAADGSRLGTVTLTPQQQTTWQGGYSGTPVWSQTPYTVIFTCKTGKQFGVFSNVQSGATINVLSSTGDRYCEPPKEGETPTTPDQPPHQNPAELYHDPIYGPP
ncbi:MAG: hypothetical protein HYZ47_00910 [Simkania negevensis]|nr:hypothetical protein [Simkania negevensis]